MSEAANESNDQGGILNPPTSTGGILRQLGPGLIIAGSIVGSGELIATTKTGAQAGMSLLWLVFIGCIVKVFVQIELGRYTVTHSETTLAALNRVPGPRMRVNWIVWYWLVMMLIGLGQVGGIVGGVGQSLALAIPFSGDYAEAIEIPSENELKRYIGWKQDRENGGEVWNTLTEADKERLALGQEKIEERLQALDENRDGRGTEALSLVQGLVDLEREAAEAAEGSPEKDTADDAIKAQKEKVNALLEPFTNDDKYWALAVTVLTIALLIRGRYGLIQNLSTVMVVGFTFITIGNVIALEFNDTFRLSLSELLSGAWPQLPTQTPAPPDIPGWSVKKPIATALATFGIIGVGATELIAYPYWCIEKGYARFAGPRTQEASWASRARGWMKVMHYDAFASMAIYTTATIAFFMMGVAVMYKQGLDPSGMRMVSILLEQYRPVFGDHAYWLFLIGAISVLYSTFLVANAGFTRMYTDALKVFGLLDPKNERGHARSVATFAVVLPFISLGIYWSGADPVTLVLLGGTMQAIMLPMLAVAALYFRYWWTDERLSPGRVWDALLIISCLGLTLAGGWKAYDLLL